jgi:hypothetical protein
MKRTLPMLLTVSLLLSILLTPGASSAQTWNLPDEGSVDADDTSPVARVARLSFVEGDVSFLRAGVTEWAPAVENLPLLAGDQIYTGPEARAEVQLARNSYIRLSDNTELTITDLSETTAQFEITEGTAIIRIDRLAKLFNRFEVDTPNTAVLVHDDGLYRIEVRGEKNSELIVRRGEADVATEQGSFKVREGHKLLIDTSTSGRLELVADNSRDDWDQWSYERDTTIARTSTDAAPDYVANYETDNNDLYGVSDLSSYGTWTNYSSYGQCWVPRVGSDWAPYRSGQWLWIPAAGWTWLATEPWGWAPYHYGRWSYLSGLGWAWVPGFGSAYRGYGSRDYHWRPALVYFFNSPSPRGNYVGWYPLAPGERWYRHDNRRGDDRAHLRLPSPRDGGREFGVRPPELHHGVSILPADGFARGIRSGIRPGAPSREVSDWISKGARSGLPEMNASPRAAAPELAENDRRRSRRLAVPANEIIKRPVVTRNPGANASAQIGAPRERRVISPQNPDAFTQSPTPRERSAERNFDRRPKPAGPPVDSNGAGDSGSRSSSKIRVPLPTPTEKGDVGGSNRERKRSNESSVGGTPVSGPEGGTNTAKEERRRARQEQSEAPAPRDNNRSTDQQRESETRNRDRKPPASEARPREDAPERSKSEDRPRDRGASAPRVEPKQERPSTEGQSHPDRHEEKQQRQERQQQQEQRKKP